MQVIDWEIETLAFSNGESVDSNGVSNDVDNKSSVVSSTLDMNKNTVEHEDVCATPTALLREVLIVLDVLGPWCKCNNLVCFKFSHFFFSLNDFWAMV